MPEERWSAEFRRMRKTVRKLGLRRGEVERLMRDARRFLSDAEAAGAAPDRLRIALAHNGAGSVRLYVFEDLNGAMPSRAVH
ncbi:MAG: hypothetical protein MUE79_06525 [Nitratireductor sp.]|nr:hypothetical protein [Nitratireductor sp.]